MKREFSDELISAYLDGELTSAEQAEVEAALRSHGELRQMVEDFQRLREELERLPRQQLDDDFADRVLRRTERTLATGDVGLAGELGANDRTAGERTAGERTAGERTAGERASGVSPFRIVPAAELNSHPHAELVPARLLLAQQTVTRRWQLACACTASAMILMIIGVFTLAATNSFSPHTAFRGTEAMSDNSQFVSSPAGMPAPQTNHFDSPTFAPTSDDSGAQEPLGASELRDRNDYALQVERKRSGTAELAKKEAERLDEPELPFGNPHVPDMPGGVGGPGRSSLADPANGIDDVDRKGLGGGGGAGGGGAVGRGVAPSGRRLGEGMGSGRGRSDDSGDRGPRGGGNRSDMGGFGGMGGGMGGLGGAMGGVGGGMGGAGANSERAAGTPYRPTDDSEAKERLRSNSATRNDRFGADPSRTVDAAKSATAPVPGTAGTEKMQRGADSSRALPLASGVAAPAKATSGSPTRGNPTPEPPKAEPAPGPAPANRPSSQSSEARPESRSGAPGPLPSEGTSQPARGQIDSKMKPIAPDGAAPGSTSKTAEPLLERDSNGKPTAKTNSEPGKPGDAVPAKPANDTAPGIIKLGADTRRTGQDESEKTQSLMLWDLESAASQPIVVLNLRLTEGEKSQSLVDDAIRESGIDVTQLSAELPQLVAGDKQNDQQRLAEQAAPEEPKPGAPKPAQSEQRQPGNRPGDMQLLIGQANQSQILTMVTQLEKAAGVTVEPTLAKLSAPPFKQGKSTNLAAGKPMKANTGWAYRFTLPSADHFQAARKDAADTNEWNVLFKRELSREAPGAKDEGRPASGQPNTEPENTDPNKGKPNIEGKPAGNEPAAVDKPNDEPGQRFALFVFVQVVPAKSATVDKVKPSEPSDPK